MDIGGTLLLLPELRRRARLHRGGQLGSGGRPAAETGQLLHGKEVYRCVRVSQSGQETAGGVEGTECGHGPAGQLRARTDVAEQGVLPRVRDRKFQPALEVSQTSSVAPHSCTSLRLHCVCHYEMRQRFHQHGQIAGIQ